MVGSRAIRPALALAVAVGAGCFGAHETDEPRRIREVLLVPEGGGEPWHDGWFDTALESDCRFLPDSAGDHYCMPMPVRSTAIRYTDPACSVPVLVDEGCAVPERVAVLRQREPWAGCGPPPPDRRTYFYQPHRVGAAVASSQVYRLSVSGTCESAELPDGELRALTPIDPTELVSMEIVDPLDGEGRLSLRTFRTSEGAVYQQSVLIERGRGYCSLPLPIYPQQPGPPRVPCIVGQSPAILAMRDCPYYGVYPTACGPPDGDFAADIVRDECGSPTEVRLYRVGEPVGPADLPEGCTLSAGGLLSLEPASPDEGHWLTDRVRGDGRLRRHFLEHPDVSLPYGPYEDTALELSCMPHEIGDEVLCLPGNRLLAGTTTRMIGLFADPACTAPATYRGTCHPFVHVVTPSCGDLLELTAVYRTTHPIDRAFAPDETTGACTEIALDSSADAHALEPIPLADLARFTRELR